MSAKSVTLGGKEYILPSIYFLGEIKRISGITMRKMPEDTSEFEQAMFDQAVDTIVAGLSRVDPNVTSDFLYAQPISPDELWNARSQVLELAGLLKKKDPKPGEDVPGQDGTGSTENSAPASA